jgi:hypothetical protein
MRLLQPGDEAALQALLRAVYGDTYSHRSLYEPGGLAALLSAGRVSLWGDFAASGELLSHTGFFHKDRRGDYLESGMSFRGANARKGTPDAEVWRRLFGWLSDLCVFVHQNTSTWHPLAQRYAERYMLARPTGVIIDYAIGERLVGVPHPKTPMQALTMTSVVRPDRLPPPSDLRLVPRGPWGGWIAEVFASLGITAIEEAPLEAPLALALELDAIEQSPALSLLRRAVTSGAEGAPPLAAALDPPCARVDLLHLPCDARMAAFPLLERAGYVPVGVRPHATRPDEVILQRLPGVRRREAMDALAAVSVTKAGRALCEGWRATCARTS